MESKSRHYQILNPTEARIFQENQVNIMDADALAPCVTKASAAMVLNMYGMQVLLL